MKISYRGSAYFGWQIQPKVPTVQSWLQTTLRHTLKEPEMRTMGASRTDTGVHAHDQRVGFTTRSRIPLGGLMRTLNHRLPTDIRVLRVWERNPGFSVRYDASAKHYTYFWCNRKLVDPFMAEYMCPISRHLDEQAMNDLCAELVGAQSFRAFQSSRDQRVSSQTTIYAAKVGRLGDLVYFDVVGHHFLYHMVRNMAKALAQVGVGDWTAEGWRSYFRSGNRSKMCVIAPAQGLHLFKIYFEEMPQPFAVESERFRELLTTGMALGTASLLSKA